MSLLSRLGEFVSSTIFPKLPLLPTSRFPLQRVLRLIFLPTRRSLTSCPHKTYCSFNSLALKTSTCHHHWKMHQQVEPPCVCFWPLLLWPFSLWSWFRLRQLAGPRLKFWRTSSVMLLSMWSRSYGQLPSLVWSWWALRRLRRPWRLLLKWWRWQLNTS